MRRRDLLTGIGIASASSRLPLAWAREPLSANDPAAAAAPADAARRLLDDGWRFHLGDIAAPLPPSHVDTYLALRAGGITGPAGLTFDDTDWQEVRLPHDWVIDLAPDPRANVSQAYRPRGIGWYRRTFHIEEAARGQYLELELGAVATVATVWVNGFEVAHNTSGYNAIRIDITAIARFGDDANVIAIQADARKMEGWWYEGGGLYRHCWLTVRHPVHVPTDGIYADPQEVAEGWTVPITVRLQNVAEAAATVTLRAALDDDGRALAAPATASAVVAPLAETGVDLSFALADSAVERWSVDRPRLYTLRIDVLADGKIIDTRLTRIGFRTANFDVDHGFFLNGKPLKIKGVCLHQDHAGVGNAVPDALWPWKLERLKTLGCNAVRFSCNAMAPELIDACDRMGFLVMAETRGFDASPDALARLAWMVRRDRNHPSIILWSLFNEEPLTNTATGRALARRMARTIKALDTRRPVTAAIGSGFYGTPNAIAEIDVIGMNYGIAEYDGVHAAYPTKPMTSSEDTSAYATRGAWRTDWNAHVIASYDEQAGGWGNLHRDAWAAIDRRPFMAGAFVWSGFDYYGEPSPFEWPSTSSFFGLMDLCGFPKASYHLRRAYWVTDRPVLEIGPHWTWPGREGQPIDVVSFTNAEEAELVLNGRSLGRRTVDRYRMASWRVPYAAGRLAAVAYRGDRIVARTAVETTGRPVALRLTPDRVTMGADHRDAQPITVEALDAAGRPVPTANLPVEFAVTGGRIIGLGNGDPNCHEPDHGSRRSLFNGLAQVIVQANDVPGVLRLTASAAGLLPGHAIIRTLRMPTQPEVTPATSVQRLERWLRSPQFSQRPDPSTPARPTRVAGIVAPDEAECWTLAGLGPLAAATDGGWVLQRAVFRPFASIAARGGRLILQQVAGRASFWLDGQQMFDKTNRLSSTVAFDVPPGSGDRVVSILFDVRPREQSGLIGAVWCREIQRQR